METREKQLLSGQTKPQPAPLQGSMREKQAQIAAIVRQCFNILDTYGKPPEALEDLILAMVQDLAEFSLKDIQAAFYSWRRRHTKIPTPAEIIAKIEKDIQARRQSETRRKTFADFDGDWPSYVRYLHDIGQLSPNVCTTGRYIGSGA